MNKKIWIVIAFFIALFIGAGVFFYFRNMSSSKNINNYEANRTSANNTSNTNTNSNTEEKKSTPVNETTQGISEAEQKTASPKKEEQIATFATKIYSNDPSRQNNISITCNTLNETIVKNGETFSFCNTVGQSSTSKGYQKADIFDKYGNKKKGLGGR